MTLPDDQVQQVQQATDIVRLVSSQIALKPRGKEFIGLCPFHDDKNPSMYVSPAKQIYKCFACGAGGDVFGWVMNYHKMTFPEALRHLAEQAGITLKDRRSAQSATGSASQTERQVLTQTNAQALSFFQNVYRHAQHGAVARDYVAQRRISPEMVSAFQIGYAPDRWDGLVAMIQQHGWNPQGFVQAGLITPRDRQPGAQPQASLNHYDRFRHRLIFPICDALGRPIAFGGRKLRSEDEPKYLNSPESPLFNKSATLYGLHLAKKPIIDSRVAVVVEGYTDVIACHQAGFRNVVATLGTALTTQHVTELRRYADKVVLIYDADQAGIKASDRAVEIFLGEQLDVAIAVLPDELDPADLFERPDGAECWRNAIAHATDALEYQFQRVQAQLDGQTTLTGRQKLAEDYLRRLAQLGLGKPAQVGGAMIRRAMVIGRLSALLHLSEHQINDLLRELTPRQVTATPASVNQSASNSAAQEQNSSSSMPKIKALWVAQRQIIGCLLHDPAIFHQPVIEGLALDEALTPAEMIEPQARELYDRLYRNLAEGKAVSLAIVLAELAESGRPELADLATAAEAQVDAATEQDNQRLRDLLAGAVRTIQAYHREQNYQQPRQQAARLCNEQFSATGHEQEDQLLRQIADHQRANPSPRRFPLIQSP